MRMTGAGMAWRTLRKRIAAWVDPDTGVAAQKRTVSRRRDRYDNSDSKTRVDILRELRRTPLTRRELDEIIGVTTCALHLPQMVARGEVQVVPHTKPYVYCLQKKERDAEER